MPENTTIFTDVVFDDLEWFHQESESNPIPGPTIQAIPTIQPITKTPPIKNTIKKEPQPKKEIEIIFAPHKEYCEIYQTKPIKFSFYTTKDNLKLEEKFSPVLCRDFLSDTLFAIKYKKLQSIYSFSFNGTTDTIDIDSTKLLVYFDTIESKENFKTNFNYIIHETEYNNKLSGNTKYSIYNNNNKIAIINGPKFWIDSVLLISLYTFLLRACCFKYKDPTNWKKELANMGGIDSDYMKDIKTNYIKYENKLKLFRETEDSITGWKDEHKQAINITHNMSGIVSIFGNKLNPKAMSNNKWYNMVHDQL